MNELEQRLTELEIRYTHQFSQLEELNEELIRANDRIDGLQREVARLRGMLAEFGPELVESPDE